MRFQHKGIQEFTNLVPLSFLYVQFHLGHTGRICGYRKHIFRRHILQHQYTGHNLCGTGHRHGRVLIFSVQNPPRIRVHQNRGCGVQRYFRNIHRLLRLRVHIAVPRMRNYGALGKQQNAGQNKTPYCFVPPILHSRTIHNLNMHFIQI